MPRPRSHDLDTVLDAARAIVLEQGARAATVAAIAKRSGAPTGSLYHAFGSRRPVAGRGVGEGGHALAAGLARRRRARRPAPGRREHGALAARVRARAHRGHAPAARHAPRGPRRRSRRRRRRSTRPSSRPSPRSPPASTGPAAHERAVLATVDLPYGAIRRRLLGGKPPPHALDGPVAAAARAILEGAPA